MSVQPLPLSPPTSFPANGDSPRPAPVWHDVSDLVTEDDTPVDNIFSEKQQRLLTEPLYGSWRGPNGDGRFVALANVGLFFDPAIPPFVPDMMLSLGVTLPPDLWPKINRSYFIWNYGKPPELVVEVVSNRKGGEDTTKLREYAKIGIEYYVIFDPELHLSDERLLMYVRGAAGYVPLTGAFFPKIGLSLILWQGSYEGYSQLWLRWADAEGKPIPTSAERAEQEKQRADGEKQLAGQAKLRADQATERADEEKQREEQAKLRADQATERADLEKQRADQLLALLRQHGIEPPA